MAKSPKRAGAGTFRCQDVALVIGIMTMLSVVFFSISRSRAAALSSLQQITEQQAESEQSLREAIQTANMETESCNASLEKEMRARATAERKVERSQEECTQMVESAVASAKAEYESNKEDAGAVRLSIAQSVLEADTHVLRAVLKRYGSSMEEEWQAHLAAMPPKGILMVAGAQKYLVNAFVSLWAVRRYWNCTLPVAIMYWGESEEETINDVTREFFRAELGRPYVDFIDASKEEIPWPPHHRSLFLPGQDRHRQGWVLKLAAAYLAPFQEVLYLDADSAPLVPPESLFTLPEYVKSGSMFWPDTFCQRPALFSELISMGLISERDAPQVNEHETESGQWLLNKKRHREALEFIMLLGTHAEFGFSKAFGDKDLFRGGFALAGKNHEYYLVPVSMGFAWGQSEPNKKNERVMRGYVQHSPQGKALFHHRAGWETKYDFQNPEGRPLDALSAPLPFTWTGRYWPFQYPGSMDDSRLKYIDPKECPYTADDLASAVEECGAEFSGQPSQRVPLFGIAGSMIEGVHSAQEKGWKWVVEARKNEKLLFENRRG